MEQIYATTAKAQDLAASMINVGLEDEAVEYLTNYVAYTANDWLETWLALDADLRSTLMFGNVDMRVPKQPEWWTNIVKANLGDKLRPLPETK